jgi:hypothetical protein
MNPLPKTAYDKLKSCEEELSYSEVTGKKYDSIAERLHAERILDLAKNKDRTISELCVACINNRISVRTDKDTVFCGRITKCEFDSWLKFADGYKAVFAIEMVVLNNKVRKFKVLRVPKDDAPDEIVDTVSRIKANKVKYKIYS